MKPIQPLEHDHPLDPTTPLLSPVPDIAKETGIKPSTLYEGLASGKIPGAIRIGRRILVHRATILKWLEEQAQGVQR